MQHNISRSDYISGVLRDEILRGQYRPTERLPSERDLVIRFETSRGTIREAFKKLEQLGVISIQPGGARVVPIEDCTLAILGPLLDRDKIPDQKLVFQAIEVGSVLVSFAVEHAMATDGNTTVSEARAIVKEMLDADIEEIPAVMGPPRLIEVFAKNTDHLVLRLMINSLRSDVVTRLQIMGLKPKKPQQVANTLKQFAKNLDGALISHDSKKISLVMQDWMKLVRDNLDRRYGK